MMRTMKKGGVYAALAAALLVTVVLVMGCIAPVDGIFAKKPASVEAEQPAPAPGLVRLNITSGSTNARTILPTLDVTDINDFDLFDLQIRENGETDWDPGTLADESDTGLTLAQLKAPIVWTSPDGDYDFRVLAYRGTGPTPPPALAAVGVDENVAITTAAGGNVTIVLEQEVAGAGDGTFTWALTGTYDTTSLTATRIGGGTGGIAADTNLSGSESLPSGFYDVAITLTLARHQTITVREILHIYAGFDSEWDRALPVLRRNSYDSVLVYHNAADGDPDATAVTGNATTPVAHGGSITDPGTPASVPANHSFDGWWMGYDAGGDYTDRVTTWPITSVIKDYTFHAKWNNLLDWLTITWEPDPDQIGDFSPVITGEGVNWNRDTGATTITLSIPTGYSNIQWYTDDPTLTFVGGTSDTASVQLAVGTNIEYAKLGTFEVYVRATYTANGLIYLSTGTITVTETP